MAATEITAEFIDEKHRFENSDGDVIVGLARHSEGDENGNLVEIKGAADWDELKPRHTYRFWGRWAEYENRRTGIVSQQFHFDRFIMATPANKEGVIIYLQTAGAGLRFGPARAKALWEEFGRDAVRTVRDCEAETLEALQRARLPLSVDDYQKLAAVLKKQQKTERCTIDLAELLNGRGFPKSTSRLLIKKWGVEAVQIVREDPYILMNFPGCGFKNTDKFYLSLGLPPDALRRQSLAAWYALHSNTNGDTWFPRKVAERGIESCVAGAKIRKDEAIQLAVDSQLLQLCDTQGIAGPIVRSGYSWAAESRKAKNEGELAGLVAAAVKEINRWPSIDGIEAIDGEQPAALAAAMAGPIGILGGSPGTGKTYAGAALIKLLISRFGVDAIGIGAPTGKAAVRLTEVLNSYGLKVQARTWHSLLGVETAEGGRWEFTHNQDNPFRYRVLIGDESSMVDTDLMAAIFRARAKGCLVLLIGDVYQLPPVGHGAPLRDLIAAGLPYGELRQIRRNSGGIVETCAAIRDGLAWEPGDNLRLFENSTPAEQIRAIFKTLEDHEHAGLDPVWDCQILAAVNLKRPLCRETLDLALRAELNQSHATKGQLFRVDDKIVNGSNAKFKALPDDRPDALISKTGDHYIANGELAKVLEVGPKTIVAQLDNPGRTILIPAARPMQNDDGEAIDGGSGSSWDLGYCLSVHKSQGSEWPVAIVMGDEYPGAKMVCSREWLYTGISRAKKVCHLIGRKATFDAMARKVSLGSRKTLLKERILYSRNKTILAEI